MRKNLLLSIFLIVFIDLLGFGLILPLLPFYAEQYGATPFVVGLLTATYAAAQMLFAPILGRLSDRYGRRPILLLSVFGTLIGFLLLGAAEPVGRFFANLIAGGDASSSLVNHMVIAMLFASRLIDGLTGGNISVAQAYISDVTDASNRARGLGLIGAAFGLGFILGPAAGGFLSTWGYSVPAFFASGLVLINLMMIATWLPESLSVEARQQLAQTERPRLSLSALWQALNRPRVGPLLHIRFFFGLAFATFQTVFPLFAQYRLGLDARGTGFVLGYVGILAALVQGVGVGLLVKRFSEIRLIYAGTVIMTISLIAWAFTPSLGVMLLVMAPLALAGGTLNTVLTSALSKAVYPEEVGGTLGLAASVESLTRVIAPSAGGFLLGQFGPWAPGVAAAGIMAWVVSFTWRRLIFRPDPPLPERSAVGM